MDHHGRDQLSITMLSVHGLVRGTDIELGRDADTGGQVSYVVDLARALAGHPRVGRVELLTRQVEGPGVSADYAVREEELAPGAFLMRLPCGPHRYLHKENLWPHLDEFTVQALRHVLTLGRLPDVVHGHYADAGYAGLRLARALEVPFVFTGHSLGRRKQARLLARGSDPEVLEERYKFRRRIRAEEESLATADLVVTSTSQEIDQQYASYAHARRKVMRVVPPGVDLERFHPPQPGDPLPPIAAELDRFLQDPDKPMILAIARPDERKNFRNLLRAYGGDPFLRETANLVVVAGVRDRLEDLKTQERGVLKEILHLIDDHDLYGRVACPKQHRSDDVPDLYRLAVRRRGVFVNPALTEPFGLTLIEAAASGLPVVATRNGGPIDIIAQCRHGVLVDPMSPAAIARGIRGVLSDPRQWEIYAMNGLSRANRAYSWNSHVETYLSQLDRITAARGNTRRPDLMERLVARCGGEAVVAAPRARTVAGGPVVAPNSTKETG
ncbi:MAG: glycosyltransferase [bacterium]|nr:glycosyltransferase [bacterium]